MREDSSAQLYNINIERIVLGSIIFDPIMLDNLTVPLKKDDFYHPFHQSLYAAILGLNEEKLPVADDFIKSRLLKQDAFNEEVYLDVLMVNPASNITSYIEELSKLRESRRLIKLLNDTREKIFQTDNIDALKETLIMDIDSQKATINADKTLAEWDEYYETQPPMPRFDTGVTIIDQGLDGLEAGQLILVGGDPEAGKTVLSVQILKTIIGYSKAVFFSFEFTVRHFVKKQKYIEGKEWVQNQNNLIIVNEGYGIDEVAVKIKQYAKEGVKFFVIDSQMRLESDQGRTVEEEETRKFSVLAKLAHKLEIIVILVFQSSKAGDNSPLGSKKAAHESSVTFFLSFPPETVKKHETEGTEYRYFEVRKNKQNGKRFKELVRLDTKKMTFHMLQKETQRQLLDPKTERNSVSDYGEVTPAKKHQEDSTHENINFTHVKI